MAAALQTTLGYAFLVLIRLVLGIILLILGVIGSVLPVLQGWVFFLLAFFVLFPKSKTTEKLVTKVGHRMPRLERFLRRMGIGAQQADTIPVE